MSSLSSRPSSWPDSWPDARHASAADHAACRTAIRCGSKSFYAASMLLPARVREPAYGLYAFCRLSDDAVDEAGSQAGRRAASARLEKRLAAAYAGRPFDAPADRALADLVVRHAIPAALPQALLEGLAWDSQGRRYRTLSDLTDYAARVAGTVGAMMTLIMGVRDAGVLARACDLGVAMQFTNIARDVGEDARAGRLYLPLDWLEEAGINPDAFLADPVATPALRAVVARLLEAADILYRRSEAGVAGLPWDCRAAIRAARLVYAEIGTEVARNACDAVSQRARVDSARKAALLLRATLPTRPGRSDAAALPETAFLIDAVHQLPVATPRALPAWWNIAGQFGRVLDLIEVLEERDAFRRSALS